MPVGWLHESTLLPQLVAEPLGAVGGDAVDAGLCEFAGFGGVVDGPDVAFEAGVFYLGDGFAG